MVVLTKATVPVAAVSVAFVRREFVDLPTGMGGSHGTIWQRLGADLYCLRDSQNLIFTGATGSETGLLRTKPTACLR